VKLPGDVVHDFSQLAQLLLDVAKYWADQLRIGETGFSLGGQDSQESEPLRPVVVHLSGDAATFFLLRAQQTTSELAKMLF
jgi:hypothetical protein